MNPTIKKNVIAYIASFTGLPADKVKDNHVLRESPLHFDDTKLANLTAALRAYLKSLNPNQTVFVTELRKNGRDVKSTCQLINDKANA